MPVSWTTHLYRPEKLAGLLADAGLEVIAELRLPLAAAVPAPAGAARRAAPGLNRDLGRPAPAVISAAVHQPLWRGSCVLTGDMSDVGCRGHT